MEDEETLKKRADLVKKWSELGFLDEINGPIRENIAHLYEGQASFLLNETTSEDTFNTIAFPIIKRVFSKTMNLKHIMDEIDLDKHEIYKLDLIIKYKNG